MSHRTLLATLGTILALSTTGVRAQTNAVRFVFPEFNSVLSGYSAFRPWGAGIGYQHQSNSGITFGLDATFTLFDLGSEISGTRPTPYLGMTGEYLVKPRSWAVIYHSTYNLNGNGDGFYLGSFIGLRQVSQELELEFVTSDYYNDLEQRFVRRAESSAMVFPVGIRLGVSGEPDGWFGDLYVQLGYQISGGNMDFVQSYLSEAAYPIKGFTYTLGYAWGIGW